MASPNAPVEESVRTLSQTVVLDAETVRILNQPVGSALSGTTPAGCWETPLWYSTRERSPSHITHAPSLLLAAALHRTV